MLVDQLLDDLALEDAARLRAGQVVEHIVVKEVFAIARQDDLVEVRMRRPVQYRRLLVDDFREEGADALLRVRDQLGQLGHDVEGEQRGAQAVRVLEQR